VTSRISWSNPRVLSTLLVVFLCGAAAGALAMKFAARQSAIKASTLLRTGNKAEILNRFQRDLELTPVQVEKIEIVLDDFMKYMSDLQMQMDDVRLHGKEQILKILDENQRRKFEKSLADLQARPAR